MQKMNFDHGVFTTESFFVESMTLFLRTRLMHMHMLKSTPMFTAIPTRMLLNLCSNNMSKLLFKNINTCAFSTPRDTTKQLSCNKNHGCHNSHVSILLIYVQSTRSIIKILDFGHSSLLLNHANLPTIS